MTVSSTNGNGLVKTLLWIAAAISISVTVSWSLIQHHEGQILPHTGAVSIREIDMMRDNIRELRTDVKELLRLAKQ